jgi:hypothetical protein
VSPFTALLAVDARVLEQHSRPEQRAVVEEHSASRRSSTGRILPLL